MSNIVSRREKKSRVGQLELKVQFLLHAIDVLSKEMALLKEERHNLVQPFTLTPKPKMEGK